MSIKAKSLKFKRDSYPDVCFSCKIICCIDANPPLSDQRKIEILNFLRKNQNIVLDLFEEAEYCHPKQKTHGQCIFFDEQSKKCTIHPVKPETCVAGPITFDIDLDRGKIQWYLKKESICPLAGWLYKNPKEFHRHLNLAKKEINKLIQDLKIQSLAAILKIEEPETFLIGEDDLNPSILKRLRDYVSESHHDCCFSHFSR